MYTFYSKQEEGNNSRVTVVGQVSNGILNLSASRCSVKDKFVRKIGRKIAEGRLLKGKHIKSVPAEEGKNSEIFIDAAKQVVEEVNANPTML